MRTCFVWLCFALMLPELCSFFFVLLQIVRMSISRQVFLRVPFSVDRMLEASVSHESCHRIVYVICPTGPIAFHVLSAHLAMKQ